MSDDLSRLRDVMTALGGHLQDLQSEQRATTRELGTVGGTVDTLQGSIKKLETSVEDLGKSVKNLEARSVHMEASMTALGGTFASINLILEKLLVDYARVTVVEESVADLKKRVETLEKKAS